MGRLRTFRTDHFQYVFQNERPKPNLNHGAGLDVSPAVRDYLGLGPTDVTDWQFVEVRDVPPGPWRSYGDNNHFVIAKRQAEARPWSSKTAGHLALVGAASHHTRRNFPKGRVELVDPVDEQLIVRALRGCRRR